MCSIVVATYAIIGKNCIFLKENLLGKNVLEPHGVIGAAAAASFFLHAWSARLVHNLKK